MVNTPHRGFSNSPKIRRLADLKLNKLKAALEEVCALRVLICSGFFFSFAGFLLLVRRSLTSAKTFCGFFELS